MTDHKLKIVGISGSLRSKSSNTAIINVISQFTSANIEYFIYDGIGTLPHFNPELNGENTHESVKSFRNLLKESNAVIICTPEYAYGIPGVLKNALDWIVSSGEFFGKKVATISASPLFSGGEKAHASLQLILTVLSAEIPEGASLTIPFIEKKRNENGEISDPETLQSIRSLLEILANHL